MSQSNNTTNCFTCGDEIPFCLSMRLQEEGAHLRWVNLPLRGAAWLILGLYATLWAWRRRLVCLCIVLGLCGNVEWSPLHGPFRIDASRICPHLHVPLAGVTGGMFVLAISQSPGMADEQNITAILARPVSS